jgi:hypothetical protein
VLLTVFRLFFAYNSSMQLSAPRPRKHRVLMSFTYRKGWHVCFFDSDRTRRAGGPKTLEDRNIFEMMIRRSFGEITLELTAEQFARLNR